MSQWIVRDSAEGERADSQEFQRLVGINRKRVYEKSLLVLIIDISPGQKYIAEDPKILLHCIDAMITFGNAHCLLSGENEVAVIASHVNQTHFLYPVQDSLQSKLSTRQMDGQFEGFLEFEETVRRTLKVVIQSKAFARPESIATDPSGASSCLASAMGRALCYINRKQKQLPRGYEMNTRICVLSGSSDPTFQYMSFMNVFYSALRLGVVIDACVMGNYSPLLSQGTDITKGMYLRPPQGHVGLLQLLLWSFLPEESLRSRLARPPHIPVDYRGSCFCHRYLISVGYVCSRCISIYCRYRPLCSTCDAFYKPPTVLPVPRPRGGGNKTPSGAMQSPDKAGPAR